MSSEVTRKIPEWDFKISVYFYELPRLCLFTMEKKKKWILVT